MYEIDDDMCDPEQFVVESEFTPYYNSFTDVTIKKIILFTRSSHHITCIIRKTTTTSVITKYSFIFIHIISA